MKLAIKVTLIMLMAITAMATYNALGDSFFKEKSLSDHSATADVCTAKIDPPTMMTQGPSWVCCSYTCTTNSGQTHDTYFCHPSSIGPTCPFLPAQSEHAENCNLVKQNQAQTCEECVSSLHGKEWTSGTRYQETLE